VNLSIPENNSVMLSSLAGSRLAAWVAHGEGMFALSNPEQFNMAAVYSYKEYPGNPNDSFNSIAALHSRDGRHLAIMPHIERTLFPWNWGYYPTHRRADEVGPWIEAFVNAREWVRGVVGSRQ
jgi:phosphoribosylformylglycinamidine synthase